VGVKKGGAWGKKAVSYIIPRLDDLFVFHRCTNRGDRIRRMVLGVSRGWRGDAAGNEKRYTCLLEEMSINPDQVSNGVKGITREVRPMLSFRHQKEGGTGSNCYERRELIFD